MDRVIGIDVSKARLDVYCLRRGVRLAVANDELGILQLAGWLEPGGLVVMEASGGYERPVHRSVTQHGVRAAVVNPLRVRQFAEASGLLAQDRIGSMRR